MADSGARMPLSAPYINHPIATAEIPARVAGATDLANFQAALLHETLKDTDTTPVELDRLFGVEVRLPVPDRCAGSLEVGRQPLEDGAVPEFAVLRFEHPVTLVGKV